MPKHSPSAPFLSLEQINLVFSNYVVSICYTQFLIAIPMLPSIPGYIPRKPRHLPQGYYCNSRNMDRRQLSLIPAYTGDNVI